MSMSIHHKYTYKHYISVSILPSFLVLLPATVSTKVTDLLCTEQV